MHDVAGDRTDAVAAEIIAAGGVAKAFVGDVADPEVAVRAVQAAEARAAADRGEQRRNRRVLRAYR